MCQDLANETYLCRRVLYCTPRRWISKCEAKVGEKKKRTRTRTRTRTRRRARMRMSETRMQGLRRSRPLLEKAKYCVRLQRTQALSHKQAKPPAALGFRSQQRAILSRPAHPAAHPLQATTGQVHRKDITKDIVGISIKDIAGTQQHSKDSAQTHIYHTQHSKYYSAISNHGTTTVPFFNTGSTTVLTCCAVNIKRN